MSTPANEKRGFIVLAELQSEVGELVAGEMLCLLTRPEFGHAFDIELYIALVASVLSFSLGVEIAPV